MHEALWGTSAICMRHAVFTHCTQLHRLLVQVVMYQLSTCQVIQGVILTLDLKVLARMAAFCLCAGWTTTVLQNLPIHDPATLFHGARHCAHRFVKQIDVFAQQHMIQSKADC